MLWVCVFFSGKLYSKSFFSFTYDIKARHTRSKLSDFHLFFSKKMPPKVRFFSQILALFDVHFWSECLHLFYTFEGQCARATQWKNVDICISELLKLASWPQTPFMERNFWTHEKMIFAHKRDKLEKIYQNDSRVNIKEETSCYPAPVRSKNITQGFGCKNGNMICLCINSPSHKAWRSFKVWSV